MLWRHSSGKKVANLNAMNTEHDLNMIYFVHFNFA